MNDLARPNQGRRMQTKPSPNMLRARMPALPHLREMFRLAEVMDLEEAEVLGGAGVTKAAFS